MHGLSAISSHTSVPVPLNSGLSSASGSAFQLPPSTFSLSTTPPAQSSGTSASLGSQTVSTLLQTQDISQQQVRGGEHGGGGGHHGGMKMPQLAEMENAEETEGNLAASLRKKLEKTLSKKIASKNDAGETDSEDECSSEGDEASQSREKDLFE